MLLMFLTAGRTPSQPELTEEPKSTFVSLLGSANFNCVASGNPQPRIQWYKDGASLAGQTGSSLFFDEVFISDRGFYHCTATNDEGTMTSMPAVLNLFGVYQYRFPVLLTIPGSGPLEGLQFDGGNPGPEVLAALASFVEELGIRVAGLQVANTSITLYDIQPSTDSLTFSSTG